MHARVDSTDKRYIGNEKSAVIARTTDLFHAICRTFFMLKKPISSDTCLQCALSISPLVGAESSCAHILDSTSSTVPKILITQRKQVLNIPAVSQFPENTRPS